MIGRWWGDPAHTLNEFRRMQQMLAHTQDTIERQAGVYPAINIYDDGETYMIRAEVPGVDKAKLDISAKGNQVSIRGERSFAPATESVAYHRRERETGLFHRVVTLPTHVAANKIAANYKNGVLEIFCPRAESEKSHKVQIA